MEENTKVYVSADPPLNSITPGAGSALFVINLCASIAPVESSGKNLPGLENYRLYQVSRLEDGRRRHRLRLGFFTSEAHAERVLTVVRQQYPTAFTTCLGDEDLKFARGYLPQNTAATATQRPVSLVSPPAPATTAQPQQSRTQPSAPPKASAAPSSAAQTAAAALPNISHSASPHTQRAAPANSAVADAPARQAQGAPQSASKHSSISAAAIGKRAPSPSPERNSRPAASAAPSSARPAGLDPTASMRAKAPDLTLCDPPAPSPQSPPASSGEPFHVAKGVDIGELRLTLQAEGAKSQGREPSPLPAARANPAGAAKAAVATPTVSTFSKPATTPKAPPAQAPQFTRTADLDNTQTIRALTSAELSDDAQEKWFTVELASSEHPVNLDAMPHLDIFEAYRLYSVATTSGGKILHSLRLGFFKEAVSVEAVCGYLKTFFASPAVLRVSIAEYTRFKDAPMRKAVDARGSATVVELSDARASRGAVPTVTMEVSAPRTSASGSSKTSAGGSHQALTPTLKPAAKSAGLAAKRSDPLPGKSGATGKHKTLEEQLLEEAREVELSQSGIRKLPKNDSLLSKLVGKLTK